MRKSESAYGIEVSCDAKTPEGPNPLGFLRHSTDWKAFPTIGSLLSIQTYRYRVRCYNWLFIRYSSSLCFKLILLLGIQQDRHIKHSIFPFKPCIAVISCGDVFD